MLRRIQQLGERQTLTERIWRLFWGPFQWLVPVAATAVVVFILVTDVFPSKTTIGSEGELGLYLENTLRMTDESEEEEAFLPADEKWNLFDLNG